MAQARGARRSKQFASLVEDPVGKPVGGLRNPARTCYLIDGSKSHRKDIKLARMRSKLQEGPE